MKYDRETKIVTREHKGKMRPIHLSDVPPLTFWNWIQTKHAHKGMFEDYCEALRGQRNER
jgi:hypothetical protein